MKYAIFFILMMISTSAYAGGLFQNRNVCDDNCFIEQFNVGERVDVIQKTVEFDAEYFLGLQGYYDVVNELQEREYTKDKDIIRKQSDQIDKLIQLLEQSLREKTGEVTKPTPQPEPQPEVSDLNKRVFDIFTKSCVDCHGDKSPKKGLQLVGQDPDGTKWLSDLSLAKRVLVYDHTAGIDLKSRGKKLMPLGGPALLDAEVETLRLWMIESTKKGK